MFCTINLLAPLRRVSGTLSSSITWTIASATATACRDRSTPSISAGSVASRNPAVSTSVNRRPSRSSVLRDEVARRPWTIRHDRAVGAKQRIEETRFPDVRVADDGDLQSFANEPPATSAGEQRAGLREEVVERPRHRARFDEVISLVWKIDRRFEARDEIEQRPHRCRRSRA